VTPSQTRRHALQMQTGCGLDLDQLTFMPQQGEP